MYSFANDYSEGAHPKVLDLMLETNLQQNRGYGRDIHCDKAKEYIKEEIQDNDAEIHFIAGGTLANLLTISAFLRPHQAVISADTGHIAVDETGAIEATGHRVITVPGKEGKITPQDINLALKQNSHEFKPIPKMVYISNTTELGTIYTKSELKAIHDCCKQNNLILFLDGARIGSALASKLNDLMMRDIADLTDVFYIGGTKNGALLGEALVIVRDDLKEDFRHLLKQRGAMLAKGFVLGIQFEALFEDKLFYQLADYANYMAEQIIAGLKKHNIAFLAEPCSNQIFPILPNSFMDQLSNEFLFETIEEIDDNHTAIRFVTSWATTQEGVDALIKFFDSNC
ncbi:MAG TPA: aminotransferase class V-fold PLP-dependent enzyme [Tissierellaceae bacterium]|nr:aminotransferase class V-fold PLP-dependent enzyme [Tissierellaceae bacterium]